MAVYTTINDGSAYFQTALYTGTGNAQTITNTGNANLQPDWVWTKNRSAAQNHCVTDTNRGLNKVIFPDVNDLQSTVTLVSSMNTDGFTISNNALVSTNGNNYVGWQWKANGGTTVTNNDGSHTSTVQANPTAGFSIVTYTGTGSGFTLGHGLGAAPEIIINKGLSDNHGWIVGATADSANLSKVLILNDTDVSTTATANFNAAPTSSVYTIGTAGGVNNNGQDYISYLFRSIQGYSKIGVYYGNGGSDGTFIYTGFKPRFFILKGTGNISSWCMYDTARDPINRASQKIWANENNAEQSTGAMDFLSNGIKMRTSDNDFNGSGNPYLYMAFADNPFVTSDGVPTTAK
jgi:hypothetical protein